MPTWRKKFLSKKRNKVKNRRSFITDSDSTVQITYQNGFWICDSSENEFIFGNRIETHRECRIFFIKLEIDKYQCNRTDENDEILKQQVSNVWIKIVY